MNSTCPKQYLLLQGKPIILHSLEALLSFQGFSEIIIVCEKEYRSLFSSYTSTPIRFATPGKERQDSVLSGFKALASSTKWVCIHDGARPLLKAQDLYAVLEAGMQHAAATLAIPLKMSVKEADQDLFVKKSLDRSTLWDIQTPQILSYPLLQRGLEEMQAKNLKVTDDVSLAELLGEPVKLVQGSYSNIKITTQDDLSLANLLLKDF